jgi:hypothetical protein
MKGLNESARENPRGAAKFHSIEIMQSSGLIMKDMTPTVQEVD